MGAMREIQSKDVASAEMLLRLVVDDDYRNEHSMDFEQALPDSVTPQTGFVELVKALNQVQAACERTCTYGLTVSCDSNSVCTNTCTYGWTVKCDCHTCRYE